MEIESSKKGGGKTSRKELREKIVPGRWPLFDVENRIREKIII